MKGVRTSCNQLRPSLHSPVTLYSYKGPLTAHFLPLPFFTSSPNDSTPQQLNYSSSTSTAKTLLHKHQYTSLNMPAQIAQPLPTQQMTASSPADAPRAVDEQPVSLTPPQISNQPTTPIVINTPPTYATRCLITWHQHISQAAASLVPGRAEANIFACHRSPKNP